MRLGVTALILIALAISGNAAGAPLPRASGLRLEKVADGLERPVHLTSPPSDPRLFVVEQPGRIRIVKDGRVLPGAFLDITDRVRDGGERGLLSMAFHPRYTENGYFYVNYTDRNGDTRIERYIVGHGPDRADPTSAKLILAVDQPYSNHNGGHILFGPDGLLYIGMGDGGSANDPHRNGQNRGALLGKMLRIDVDRGDPYTNPPGNAFRDDRDGRPEIWALGLRNPWRFCFDRRKSTLYIADVGQDRWEEINVAVAGASGLNYGWNLFEGTHPLRRSGGGGQRSASQGGFTAPAVEYPHSEGCSVTGGVVYRGRRIPQIAGHYFYADYCRGWIRSFRYEAGQATDPREWELSNVGPISSFGEDAEGELYVIAHEGAVYRIASAR